MTISYQDLTDHQINKIVKKHYHKDWAYFGHYDPCNDASQAWPIILKHGISIDFWGDHWGADIQLDGEIGFEYEHENPLRAAMICYIMMMESNPL